MARKRKFRGFTLIEVLVAMTLATVVIMLLATSLMSTSDRYNSLTQQVAAQVEARACLDLLAKDILGFAGNWDWKEGSTKNSWRNDRCVFLSSQSHTTQPVDEVESDLCKVSYYTKITRDDVDSKRFSRKLYRSRMSSQKTFEELLRGNDLAFPHPNTQLDEPVAYGVLSFNVEPYFYQNDQLVRWTSKNIDTPEFIEITLVIVGQQWLARLEKYEDWLSEKVPVYSREDTAGVFRYSTRLKLSK